MPIMKLARTFCFLIVLGSLSVVASGQTPIDPKVIINKIGDPACGGSGQPMCYDGSKPLKVAFAPVLSFAFVYDGPPNLTELFLRFTGVPTGTEFQCQTDIWTTCTTAALGAHRIQFHMFGGPGTCTSNGGVMATCPGFLAPGDGFTLDVVPSVSATPEPASVFLFGTGLIIVLLVTKRRLHAGNVFA